MNNVEIKNDLDYKGVKKNYTLLIIVIILLVFVVGGTFAYFFATASNNIFTGNMGNVKLTLTVTKVLPTTNGVDDILVTNFSELAGNLNNRCVDNYGEYALCQLYRINLANASDGINTNVQGSVAFDNETTPNLSWIFLGNSYSSSTNYTSAMLGNDFNTSSSTHTNFVDSYLLETGSNIDFYILVWINETEGEQIDEGAYSGTVRFIDSNGDGVTATFSS